jgi:hypothetical protein
MIHKMQALYFFKHTLVKNSTPAELPLLGYAHITLIFIIIPGGGPGGPDLALVLGRSTGLIVSTSKKGQEKWKVSDLTYLP